MKSSLEYIKNHQWAMILALVILAGAVRLVIAWNTYVISSDGPVYISVAQNYYQGNYKAALNHPYHPLYPFMMSLAYRVVGDWEWAGLLISILFGALAVIPLWFIGRMLFPGGQAVVLTGCLLYIFHPLAARFAAGVLTTGLFICLLLFTVWMLLAALTTYKHRYFALTSIGALLVYLTRPDGVLLLLLALAMTILIDIQSIKKTLGKRFIAVCFLILPWLIAASPYLYHLYKTKGHLEITQKFSVEKIQKLFSKSSYEEAHLDNPDDPDWVGTPLSHREASLDSAFYIVAEDMVKGAHIVVFLLLLVYILFARSGFSLREPVRVRGVAFRESPGQPARPNDAVGQRLLPSRIIWVTFAVYLLALLVFAAVFGRLSKRYTTPLAILVIFYAADGLWYLLGKIKREHLRPAGVVIILLIFSVHTFAPIGKDKVIQKTIGKQIEADYYALVPPSQSVPPPKIITASNRIVYYANGCQVPVLGRLMDQLRQADYIVVDKYVESLYPEVRLWPGDNQINLPDHSVVRAGGFPEQNVSLQLIRQDNKTLQRVYCIKH